MTNPARSEKRSIFDIARAIANQPKGENTHGAKKTLVPWSLIDELREALGPGWRVNHNLATGRPLTTHPVPNGRAEPLPDGKTCEDCQYFAFCRSMRNVSGQTTCSASANSVYAFKQKSRRYRPARRF